MDAVGRLRSRPWRLTLEITRTFDATRPVVFDTFTVCDAARRWMGPVCGRSPGARSTCGSTCGSAGVYRFVWKNPHGYEVDNATTRLAEYLRTTA